MQHMAHKAEKQLTGGLTLQLYSSRTASATEAFFQNMSSMNIIADDFCFTCLLDSNTTTQSMCKAANHWADDVSMSTECVLIILRSITLAACYTQR